MLSLKNIDATIERRLLVNYRVDIDAVVRMLPAPFEPRVVNGFAMAGICLIHLRNARPAGVPSQFGIESQGAAHRVAVTWTRPDGERINGVYIPRRDSGSRVVTTAAGRSLATRRADFTITETMDTFDIAMASSDGEGSLNLKGDVVGDLADSTLGSLTDAYTFFRDSGPGFSQRPNGRFSGIALDAVTWKLDPVALTDIHSAWFDDANRFPIGTAVFDSALVMRRTESQWRSVPDVAA